MSTEYFIGKSCTIFTTPINEFKTENPSTYPPKLIDYFVGFVESINENGVLISQASTGLKTWFYKSHVIGIAEEALEIPEPEIKKVESKLNDSKFVDIENIEKLAKKYKQN